MIERLIKWFSFSVGLSLLPIILSLFFHGIFNLEIHFSNYTSELIFISVTLSATSIGDIVSILQKGIKGVHITVLLIVLIFISLICVSIYEMVNISNALKIITNTALINLFTIISCISSLTIGIFCQVYLQKIEGK